MTGLRVHFASISRPNRAVRKGSSGRELRASAGDGGLVEHFLQAVRSCPLGARQSWRVRGIALEVGGRC